MLEPVRVGKAASRGTWTEYLVLFLRIMAGISMVKGVYHWSQVCGIGVGHDQAFQMRGIAWQIVEAGGVISRADVRDDLAALSPEDRKSLGKFAIRIGTYGVWLPSVLKPRAMTFARAFAAREGGKALEGEGLRELLQLGGSPFA